MAMRRTHLNVMFHIISWSKFQQYNMVLRSRYYLLSLFDEGEDEDKIGAWGTCGTLLLKSGITRAS